MPIRKKSGSAGAARAAQQEPFARVAPVLGAALLLGAAAGFALAALLTLTRALGVREGAWWLALAQAHGHTQLYGWAGLFVLGVALHFLPRLRGAPLAAASAVPGLLTALVAGLVLRLLAQPLAAWTGAPIWRWLLLTSALLEAAAWLGFVLQLAQTARRGPPLASRPAFRSVLPLLICALASLALAAFANLASLAALAITPPPAAAGLIPAAPDTLNVTLGLFGFLVPMALAMSARSLPMYAGLDAFPQVILWPLAGGYIVGVALLALGGFTGADALAGAGLVGVGAALGAFVVTFLRLMRTRGRLPERVARLAPTPAASAAAYRTHVAREAHAYGPFVALIAAAYAWAAFGGVLLLVDGLALCVGTRPPIPLDAARHSLAAGFLALLLCGVAPRLVPGFSGGHIRAPALVWATLWVGNAAALLRVGSVLLAATFAPAGWAGSPLARVLFGLSGPLGWTLAIMLAINLWPAIWPRAHGSNAIN